MPVTLSGLTVGPWAVVTTVCQDIASIGVGPSKASTRCICVWIIDRASYKSCHTTKASVLCEGQRLTTGTRTITTRSPGTEDKRVSTSTSGSTKYKHREGYALLAAPLFSPPPSPSFLVPCSLGFGCGGGGSYLQRTCRTSHKGAFECASGELISRFLTTGGTCPSADITRWQFEHVSTNSRSYELKRA